MSIGAFVGVARSGSSCAEEIVADADAPRLATVELARCEQALKNLGAANQDASF